jgi:hypothetical protein
MYAWIWRHLPGGVTGKVVGTIMLATAAMAVLWFVIFPWVAPRLPVDRVMPGG